MVAHGSRSDTPANGPVPNIDPYALFEVLTGRKMDRPVSESSSSHTMSDDYDSFEDLRGNNKMLGREPSPDEKPNNVRIGAINPYALVEAMLGRELDRHSMSAIRVISDVLQTDYDELFDMKHHSVLFAGLKLNKEERKAEELSEQEMKILDEKDLTTPDLADVDKLEDLEKIGLKQLGNTRVKMARMQNGKLRLILEANELGKTVSNRQVTLSINELATRFRRERERKFWTPPNGTWENVYETFYARIARRMITDEVDFRIGRDHSRRDEMMMFGRHFNSHGRRFDDPVQGCASNSWFVAALFSVFWANPSVINRHTRHQQSRFGKDSSRGEERYFEVKFHDKGGHNNNGTQMVKVDYEMPVNNTSNDLMYCRSSDGFEIWPALYEKAFAKWITGNNSDRPDITQTSHGDPIKAMAQINGREPCYYFCEKHSASELAGLVRSCSVNYKTINPMVAYTYATGGPRNEGGEGTTTKGGEHAHYHGLNLVANHAYSVLGYSTRGQGDRQYIVLRNPWGVTEPHSITSYEGGMIDNVKHEYWPPANLLDREGVFAVEARAFKAYFQCIGLAR